MARAGQYTRVPPWYKGSLEDLKAAIQRAVHKHFKGIEVAEKNNLFQVKE